MIQNIFEPKSSGFCLSRTTGLNKPTNKEKKVWTNIKNKQSKQIMKTLFEVCTLNYML